VPVHTARVTTGRPDGGEHRYFSVPPGVRIGNRALSPGLDVRHAAGYVLVPPSVHPSGVAYRWQGAPAWAPGAVLPLPGVLLERLMATPRTAPPPRPPGQRGYSPSLGIRGAPDAATCWRLARYVAKVPGGLSDGRKTTAFSFAAALLHDFTLARADAWAVLAGWNAENAPPLERARLETILDNAARYGGRRPRGRVP
jgi:hypothetical protein